MKNLLYVLLWVILIWYSIYYISRPSDTSKIDTIIKEYHICIDSGGKPIIDGKDFDCKL